MKYEDLSEDVQLAMMSIGLRSDIVSHMVSRIFDAVIIEEDPSKTGELLADLIERFRESKKNAEREGRIMGANAPKETLEEFRDYVRAARDHLTELDSLFSKAINDKESP